MSDVSAQKGQPTPPHTGPMVPVTINGTAVSIHRGHRTVTELKQAGGVNPAHELEQVENGQLQPLPDDGGVTLKGGEVFISHPRDSASS